MAFSSCQGRALIYRCAFCGKRAKEKLPTGQYEYAGWLTCGADACGWRQMRASEARRARGISELSYFRGETA